MTEYNFEEFRRETRAERLQKLRKKLLSLSIENIRAVRLTMENGFTFIQAMKRLGHD